MTTIYYNMMFDLFMPGSTLGWRLTCSLTFTCLLHAMAAFAERPYLAGTDSGQMRAALTGHAGAVIASRACGAAIQEGTGCSLGLAPSGLLRRKRSSQ